MGLFGGFIDKFKKGLQKTKEVFLAPIKAIARVFRNVAPEDIDALEERLIEADFGVEVTQKIIDKARKAYKNGEIKTTDQIVPFLKADLKTRLVEHGNDVKWAPSGPTVILVAGVNGVGKTTSIAKLATLFRKENRRVILAASDTFRAAAVELDAADAAIARKADVLLVDTAGRLQTKENLMKELSKIRNVISRKIPGAPHEVLLVLDATTGQNAISQAQHFGAAVNVTGLFLAKLDGTAKGGIVVAIKDKLSIPVKFVGLGEFPEDIARFNADEFVEALFGDDAPAEAPAAK